MIFSFFRKKKGSHLNTISFYNLENLFDTIDDPKTLDDDFTPKGRKKWSLRRYKKKLYKLAKTIAEIGNTETQSPPVLVGVAEIENEQVMQDLLASEPLANVSYDYVHYDSPDERGIDCGLIYHKDHFEVLYSEPIAVLIYEEDERRDTTRDILYVKGKLNNEQVHIFVNHWPSRRSGNTTTEHKRMIAAETMIRFMARIEEDEAEPNYIIMGDFNDGPQSDSIKKLIDTKTLYNPMEKLLTPDRGSANYKRSWMLFDQIMVSHSFLNFEKGTHSFAHANIFDEHFLTEFKGKYMGSPYRTYVGNRYLGGYSDHFPVYIQLKYNA
ncbi:endonuclease/exonuclease/phosphatase family protein [Zobellia galactanivorans]|uniref:Endonuclease/exonuclease/phosphatase family n=1 Tax=Zobellia galactanivorans (strain DSM 12802 / CCUG 47099 / CIP 106680 / NCIMB 13871 / Dsij) TaxID=63186 RepID=G0L520_ZOBGA|nr:endonuclease [Zobellia galactanivorans]CAZ95902.1 Endonuclease/exonuclease/phosphatase family [Zobellia galactanivorans]